MPRARWDEAVKKACLNVRCHQGQTFFTGRGIDCRNGLIYGRENNHWLVNGMVLRIPRPARGRSFAVLRCIC